MILAEGRVRKKHGGLVMARVKYSESFLGAHRGALAGLDVFGQDSYLQKQQTKSNKLKKRWNFRLMKSPGVG